MNTAPLLRPFHIIPSHKTDNMFLNIPCVRIESNFRSDR
jgi:hypothetical protein